MRSTDVRLSVWSVPLRRRLACVIAVALVAALLASCAGSSTSSSRPSSGSPSAAVSSPGASAAAVHTLSGRITDASGHGVNDYSISFNGGQIWSRFTNPDGSFSIGLPPGIYTLQLSATDGAHPSGYLGATGLVPTPDAARQFDLTSKDAVVDVVLPASYSLTGRLTDEQGKPLADFLVELVSPPRFAFSPDEQSPVYSVPAPMARTALDGTFTISGIVAGSWAVAVQDPDRQGIGYLGSGASFTLGPPPAIDITGNLALPPARLPDSFASQRAGHRISGRVTDGQGHGVADQIVSAILNGKLAASCTTAADGTYVLGDLAPGSYTVSFGSYARQAGGQIDTGPIVVGSADATGVDASPWLPTGGLSSSLPTMVAGITLTRFQFAPWGNPQILTALGKNKADVLETAEAKDHAAIYDVGAETIDVIATRIRGENPTALRDAWRAWEKSSCPTCTETISQVDGKMVLAVGVGSQVTYYAYAKGDVMFEVSAKTPALARAALDALP